MVDIKAIACEAIDAAATELHALSDSIWHHPELAYEEKHAHKILTEFLEQQGFKVKFNYVKYIFTCLILFSPCTRFCRLL